MIFDIKVFFIHKFAFHGFSVLFSRLCFLFGLALLEHFPLLFEGSFEFSLIRIDISDFVGELSLFGGLLLMFFLSFKDVLNYILILFFVLFCFLGARQLFNEQDVNYLDEFILNQLIVYEV